MTNQETPPDDSLKLYFHKKNEELDKIYSPNDEPVSIGRLEDAVQRLP